MATRSGQEYRTIKQISQEVFKIVTKVYLFWLAGVGVGVIGLRPTTVSSGGLSLAIGRPELIQGIIYWIALFYAGRVFLSAYRTGEMRRTPSARRLALWSSLPVGTRSLRGMTKAKLVEVKNRAKIGMVFMQALPGVLTAIPVFFIVVFNPLKLLWTLGAMVGIF